MPIMRRADVDSDRNHRNPEGLSTIDTFREYGIAAVAVASIHVSKGDTLKLNTAQNQWVLEADPMMSE